jgi:ABC-type microcin C transport system duplicated ATPase subunit YejF
VPGGAVDLFHPDGFTAAQRVSAEDVPALVDLIRGLTRHTGRSVLMVEHHMDVVLDLAHRVAVMHHGALLVCDTPAAVMADRAVQKAHLGEGLSRYPRAGTPRYPSNRVDHGVAGGVGTAVGW